MHYWDMNHCQSGWVETDQEISETTQYIWLKDKNGKEIEFEKFYRMYNK